MENKTLTFAVIGCGGRGHCYANCMLHEDPDTYKITSACDINPERLEYSRNRWNLNKEQCFTDENEFFKEKRAELLVLATQDRDHVRQAIKALELGYHILLEKPISPVKEELYALLDAQKKYNKTVLVCHVLRYSPAFVKIKEILDSGVIGDLRLIESIEQVAFWHQAHSFIRGNWRREDETSPMIMQKCCHDMDLLQYYVGAKCDTVYSVGDLSYFNKEHKPENTPDNCIDCRLRDTCPYSAEYSYIVRWKEKGSPENLWPFNVITRDYPLTEEKLRYAYANGPYGRCVFSCDNDVVDNQQVLMTFENGVKVSHTMTAFTHGSGRIITLHGTLGEIKFTDDAGKDAIQLLVFGKEPKSYSMDDIAKDAAGFGHGGGDYFLCKQLYDMIKGGAKANTTLTASVESHLMALAAEESRKTGKPVKIIHKD